MPRTQNVTRQQWQAAISPMDNPNATAIRVLGSASPWRQLKTSHPPLGDMSTNSSLKENHGYNQGYDDGREQSVDETSKDKGVHEEIGKRQKPQPLQDITDLVASHRLSGVGGRRVRRRHRVGMTAPAYPVSPSPVNNHASITRISFTSSLPPSSPLPPVSFGLPTSDARQFLEDIILVEQEELPLASDDPELARNSDPFGFFAVEKELKAQRDRDSRPGPYTEIREAGGSVLVPASSPAPLQLDITTIMNDSEVGFVSPCATPKKPHKRKPRSTANMDKGRKKDDLLLSPRTESLPSSPSPLKVRETRKTFRHRSSSYVAVCSDGNTDRDVKTHTPIENSPCRELRSMAEANQSAPLQRKARAKRERENRSSTPSDPVELARKLLDRLPKRRKRHLPVSKPCREKRQHKSYKATKNSTPAGVKVEVCAPELNSNTR